MLMFRGRSGGVLSTAFFESWRVESLGAGEEGWRGYTRCVAVFLTYLMTFCRFDFPLL